MALTDKLTAIANAIRARTGKTESLTLDQMPTEIESITTGGGSSADCCYVTFRNEATGEEFVKPVATGDDCVDVVAKGLWAKPTKPSDAQYDYTFYGWGASDGGAADANILKNITEDKTVYAIFTATVKYYTITYYDEDGTTVLKTESLAYGAMPSYVATKDGYILDGWVPEFATVTGNASYVAKWKEGYSFAKSSWADIAAISEAGEAQQYFKIGDTREEYLGSTIGNAMLMIIGFNHDDLADGSGKAGMTIGMVTASDSTISRTTSNQQDNDHALPTEIAAVAKNAKYSIYNNDLTTISTAQMVLFDWNELGLTNDRVGNTESATYPAVTSGVFPKTANTYSGNLSTYWLRGYSKPSTTATKFIVNSQNIINGQKKCSDATSGAYNIRGHFCV